MQTVTGKPDQARLETSSFKSAVVLRDYFDAHHLRSNKALAYYKWCRVLTMVLNKEHLTQDGLELVRKLGKDINKN